MFDLAVIYGNDVTHCSTLLSLTVTGTLRRVTHVLAGCRPLSQTAVKKKKFKNKKKKKKIRENDVTFNGHVYYHELPTACQVSTRHV